MVVFDICCLCIVTASWAIVVIMFVIVVLIACLRVSLSLCCSGCVSILVLVVVGWLQTILCW